MTPKESPSSPAGTGQDQPIAEIYSDFPFDGLFGNTVVARVLAELIADPYRSYRAKELVELVESSPPSVRQALTILSGTGLVGVDQSDPRHLEYFVKVSNRRVAALTFLLMAAVDDRTSGEADLLGEAIADYAQRNPSVYAKLAPIQNNIFLFETVQSQAVPVSYETRPSGIFEEVVR